MRMEILYFSLLGSASLLASDLVTPTIIETNGISEFFPAINIVNDSGLSSIPTIEDYESVQHAPASATTAWTSNNPNGADDYFLDGTGSQVPEFTFALPDTYLVKALVYWGYFFSSTNGNETREFVVEFSIDGGKTFPETETLASNLGEITGASAKTLVFENEHRANTLRIRLTDNHYGGGAGEAGGDRMGLGEIKFIASLAPSEALAITDFEILNGEVVIKATAGLRTGTTYHLESSMNLENFGAVPGSDFTSESLVLPTVPAAEAKLFVRIAEGPAPQL